MGVSHPVLEVVGVIRAMVLELVEDFFVVNSSHAPVPGAPPNTFSNSYTTIGNCPVSLLTLLGFPGFSEAKTAAPHLGFKKISHF